MKEPCNHLPREFGPSSTVHGWFQRFVADGVLREVWACLVAECDALGEVFWEWQAADGVTGKSRFDGEKRGPNPTDRADTGPEEERHRRTGRWPTRGHDRWCERPRHEAVGGNDCGDRRRASRPREGSPGPVSRQGLRQPNRRGSM